MKSEKNRLDNAAFWQWFAEVSSELATDVENADLLDELDARVEQLNPNFSWEIGPGKDAEWCLAISPNLDAKLLPKTESVVADAPSLRHWEFAPTRQRKEWDGRFEIERESGECLSLDSSDWRYVLLRYPDGAHEVILQSKEASKLSDDERWTAAAIALEGLLGERTLLDKVEKFDLLKRMEPQLALQAKPLAQLPNALGIDG